MSRLSKKYYESDQVVDVAKDLIGKLLITEVNGIITSGMITETEAYHQSEKACHAYNGRHTARTKTLFEPGGVCYVYLCYGIHNLFNVVTGKKGEAAAVLIRAIEPKQGKQEMLVRRKFSSVKPSLTAGPGRLSQALGLSLKLNGASLISSDALWIETFKDFSSNQISAGKRIGVDYAAEDALLPWRFFLKNNQWVSR